MNNKSVRTRLVIMSFLQFAVWGAYLTSMGNYLGKAGLAEHIGWFYSMQGLVSIFMPALVGIVADKFLSAQKVLAICHGIAGAAMIAAGYYCMTAGCGVEFGVLFPLYTLSVAFYMPTEMPKVCSSSLHTTSSLFPVFLVWCLWYIHLLFLTAL